MARLRMTPARKPCTECDCHPVAFVSAAMVAPLVKAVRARWRTSFRQDAPTHLARHILFAMLAYRLQAEAMGDLDAETVRFLKQVDLACGCPCAPYCLASVGCSMMPRTAPQLASLLSLSSGSPSVQSQPACCTTEAPHKLLAGGAGSRSSKSAPEASTVSDHIKMPVVSG
jgi:hypothetical protein